MTQQQQQTSSHHPDADLYPEATGLAATLVKAHSKEQPLKLYAGWFCPFVQRVWLVLEEKQIPYQYIEVNPYHKPKSLLDLNPRGLVPTLQYDGKPLYESTVVCEFLEEVYSTSPLLLPWDPYQRARSRIWIDFVTSRIIPAFHRFLQYQPPSPSRDGGGGGGEREDKDSATAGLAEKRADFLARLKEFTAEMDPRGPFFWGEQPTLVDLAIAPWAVRLWIFDHFKGGLGIPDQDQAGEDEQIWQRWRKWVAAIEQRKSIKETTSDKEHYLPIYQRYADNTAQSELAKATREGRGVP